MKKKLKRPTGIKMKKLNSTAGAKRAVKAALSKGQTTLEKLSTGAVRITHNQAIRQSISYQSAEYSYAVSFEVDAANVEAGITAAEETVEGAVTAKFAEVKEALTAIAESNGH